MPLEAGPESNPATPSTALVMRSDLLRWLAHDWPYIAILGLALVGVVFRLPVIYWVILTPVYAIISIAAGWRHFGIKSARLELVYSLGLTWCALLLAIWLLFDSGVQGVLNANARSLVMMILLALGTFTAGVQAKVWRICAVGAVLFLAVPSLGWLDQSPLLLTAATIAIIALGGAAWWLTQRGGGGETAATSV
jgi:hypothetical protein